MCGKAPAPLHEADHEEHNRTTHQSQQEILFAGLLIGIDKSDDTGREARNGCNKDNRRFKLALAGSRFCVRLGDLRQNCIGREVTIH